MRQLFLAYAAISVVGLVNAIPAQAPERFSLTAIGSLPDADPSIPTDPTSTVTGINEAGHTTGSSWVNGGCVQQPPAVICERIIVHAVLWRDGTLQDLGPPIAGLTPLQYTTIGFAINNNDWIAGEYTTDLDSFRHAFVWRQPVTGNGITELPSLNGTSARAWDINDDGVVVGESNWSGGLGTHAVFWTEQGGSWVATDLGTFGGAFSQAFGINSQGEITGVSATTNQQSTFLYLPQPAYGLPAGMHDVTPQVTGDFCDDINDKGEMVGGAGGAFPLPMIVLPEPAYGLPAGPTVFGVNEVAPQSILDELGADFLLFAAFTSINNNGFATVNAWFRFSSGSQQQHGMVFHDGAFRLAKSVIIPSQRWPRMTGAEDVNDSAQIGSSGVDLTGNFLGAVMEPAECQENLGFQGPGAAAATLCGSGLNAGESSDYEVLGAPISASGALFISMNGFPNVATLGGTLVSFGGFAIQSPLVASPSGDVSFTVPGAGIALDLVVQSLFLDGSTPRGVAFTNAIRAQFGQ